jgi:hypothetical protein
MPEVDPLPAFERGMERLTRFRIFNQEPDFLSQLLYRPGLFARGGCFMVSGSEGSIASARARGASHED